jgi:hypothetical protein
MNGSVKKTTIAGQLSTVHSTDEFLNYQHVRKHLQRMVHEVPLDILIVGWEEKNEIFEQLTSKVDHLANQIFLWYPFLSDYPEIIPQHLVINIDDAKSKGWDGYGDTGIKESFKQACPNNPFAISTSLKQLERLLTKYEFDGVFIDKIRFPSMANGMQDVLTCFCPYCEEKAAQTGLDLTEVKNILKSRAKIDFARLAKSSPSGASWLEQLIIDQPVLQQFIQFRKTSINRVIAEIHDLLRKLIKKMALDVFSPSLAPLVGQDFGYMATVAEWVKPMIYRIGSGPSSLRSEIPALINELSHYTGTEIDEVSSFITSRIEGLQGVPLSEIEKVAPLSLIQSETKLAVNLLAGTPVYLGLETVHIPGKMEITPKHVQEILDLGAEANVQGYVLSWDLLHTPIENVIPLKSLFP